MAYTNPVDALTSSAVAQSNMGIHVSKLADLTATTPFETAIFDVTGIILINLLWGEVTTTIATTTTILIQRQTGPVVMSAATTITADAAGTMYMWSGDPGEIFCGAQVPVIGFATVQDDVNGRCVFGLAGASEVIEVTADQAGTAGAAITWHMYYTPLEAGAKAVASA